MFTMSPRWFFSSAELNKYLKIAIRKWDTRTVGAQMESYMVAGGNITCEYNVYKLSLVDFVSSCAPHFQNESHMAEKQDKRPTFNPTRYGAYLCEIWSTLRVSHKTLTAKITGNPKVKMSYVNFHDDIIERYHINIVGWLPTLRFVNTSSMSDSLPPLQGLCNALKNGTCKFVRLSAVEVKAQRAQIEKDRATGKVPPRKTRKQRKDAGVPQTNRRDTSDSDDPLSNEPGDEASHHNRSGGPSRSSQKHQRTD
jgi:hypothetical protein